MKKVLAVLAVVFLFSGSLFATPAEIAANGGLSTRFLNVEDNALINPALFGNYVNKAVIGVTLPVFGAGPFPGTPQATGLAILNAGPGALGIIIAPRELYSVDSLTVATTAGNIPQNTFGLGYSLDLKGMKAGLSLIYGADNTSTKAQWVGGVELIGKDEAFTSNTVIKLAAGLALSGSMPIDVAVSLALPKYEAITKDYDNSQNKLQTNPSTTFGAMDIALDAKTEVAGLQTALNVTLRNLTYQQIAWYDDNLNGDATDPADVYTVDTETDSGVDVSLLAAKVIKATDNMTVTIGSGLNLGMSGDYKDTTEDKVAGTKTINSANADSGMSVGIPFNIAVNVALGKFVTWENAKWAMTVGLSKEAALLTNSTDKTINPANENTVNKTDASDFSNNSPAVGGIGLKWELSDAKVYVGGGAKLYSTGTIVPNVALNFAYDWK